MHWIKAFNSLRAGTKVKHFARALGAGRHETIGRLVCLWLFVGEISEDGDISDWDDEEFTLALGQSRDDWPELLCEHGFCDRTEDGRLLIHNWEETYVLAKQRKLKQASRKRQSEDSPKTVRGQSEDGPKKKKKTVRSIREREKEREKERTPPYGGVNSPPPNEPGAIPFPVWDSTNSASVTFVRAEDVAELDRHFPGLGADRFVRALARKAERNEDARWRADELMAKLRESAMRQAIRGPQANARGAGGLKGIDL